jgi:hypothetical protein
MNIGSSDDCLGYLHVSDDTTLNLFSNGVFTVARANGRPIMDMRSGDSETVVQITCHVFLVEFRWGTEFITGERLVEGVEVTTAFEAMTFGTEVE